VFQRNSNIYLQNHTALKCRRQTPTKAVKLTRGSISDKENLEIEIPLQVVLVRLNFKIRDEIITENVACYPPPGTGVKMKG
jgi:hypothetical protein